jgi:hypothetical protein
MIKILFLQRKSHRKLGIGTEFSAWAKRQTLKHNILCRLLQERSKVKTARELKLRQKPCRK